jgi:hypothetical protein
MCTSLPDAGAIELPVPDVQYLLLVHTVGVLYGFCVPASEPASAPASGSDVHICPFGVPEETHAANVAISVDVGATAGGGGIGLVVDCMRTSDSCAIVFEGSFVDVAIKSAYVRSGIDVE